MRWAHSWQRRPELIWGKRNRPGIVSADTARMPVASSGDGDRTFKIAAETQVSSPLRSSAV